ncbi:MAG: OB-fold nucleic acid binding domain-containing protein, partial [Candidatus Hydrogenedentota bacterium]
LICRQDAGATNHSPFEGGGPQGRGMSPFAVRMGLHYVKGLGEPAGRRITQARAEGPFTSLTDLAARARLDENALARLAECGALEGFKHERRDALWESLGMDPDAASRLQLGATEPDAAFAALAPFETYQWDYAYTGHSPRGHPLQPLREALARQRMADAARIRGYPNGRRVRYAGLVICRQRPGTAKGVLFMTLEDETGFVNVVVWEHIFRKYETLAKTASFLGVTGKLQSESGVVHLIADKLWIPELDAGPTAPKSRDFH